MLLLACEDGGDGASFHSSAPGASELADSGFNADASVSLDASAGAGANDARHGDAAGTGSEPAAPLRDAAAVDTGSDAKVQSPVVDASSLAFIVAPTLRDNERASAPLVAILELETNRPAEFLVTVSGGGEQWTLTLPEATSFEEAIVGLKPDTTYSVELDASDGEEHLLAAPLSWTSPPLPEDFPLLKLVHSEPSRMEPGMTLFNVNTPNSASLVVVDHEGEVRWFFLDPDNPAFEDPRRLYNGNFLVVRSRCSVMEVDLRGEIVRMWHASEFPGTCEVPDWSTPVPIQALHHDVQRLPSGNFLALSTEVRMVEDYPTSVDDADAPRAAAAVMGAIIVEFTADGEVIEEVPLLDLLDPTRVSRDSLSTSWPASYSAPDVTAYDWDHANAVALDEAADAYYVSLRHQDAVIKIKRSTKELLWILGTHANWDAPWSDKLLTRVGELQWPFHQHSVELNPLGFALYDNGNHRAAAFETPAEPYSRAVIYAVNEDDFSVEEVWSYGSAGDDAFFSPTRGDADWQPETGNMVLATGNIRTASGAAYGQVLEVTPEGDLVFELDVGDRSDDESNTSRHSIYRAQRLSDLRSQTAP